MANAPAEELHRLGIVHGGPASQNWGAVRRGRGVPWRMALLDFSHSGGGGGGRFNYAGREGFKLRGGCFAPLRDR
eukprot:g10788.t1